MPSSSSSRQQPVYVEIQGGVFQDGGADVDPQHTRTEKDAQDKNSSNGPAVVDAPILRRFEMRNGSIRLKVTFPTISPVTTEWAARAVQLLTEEMTRVVQQPQQAHIQRMKLCSLRFMELTDTTIDTSITSESSITTATSTTTTTTTMSRSAVQCLADFIRAHATTITHLSMRDMIREAPHTIRDEHNVREISMAVQSSKLEILNLSENVLPWSTWRWWTFCQSSLRQLILNCVTMDATSLSELATGFAVGTMLQDLHVVLNEPLRVNAVGEACDLLEQCRNLSSLRWANKVTDTEAKLPWFGLNQMITIHSPAIQHLEHLIMDGTSITVSELGSDGLHGALQRLSNLKTLKLRNNDIRDDGVRSIVSALWISQPPLEVLDLSDNRIQCTGARTIAEVFQITPIATHLDWFVLQNNSIGNDGACCLFRAGASCGRDVDLHLDGNPLDLTKVAMQLAQSEYRTQQAQERLKEQITDSKQGEHYEKKIQDMRLELSGFLQKLQMMEEEYRHSKKGDEMSANMLGVTKIPQNSLEENAVGDNSNTGKMRRQPKQIQTSKVAPIPVCNNSSAGKLSDYLGDSLDAGDTSEVSSLTSFTVHNQRRQSLESNQSCSNKYLPQALHTHHNNSSSFGLLPPHTVLKDLTAAKPARSRSSSPALPIRGHKMQCDVTSDDVHDSFLFTPRSIMKGRNKISHKSSRETALRTPPRSRVRINSGKPPQRSLEETPTRNVCRKSSPVIATTVSPSKYPMETRRGGDKSSIIEQLSPGKRSRRAESPRNKAREHSGTCERRSSPLKLETDKPAATSGQTTKKTTMSSPTCVIPDVATTTVEAKSGQTSGDIQCNQSSRRPPASHHSAESFFGSPRQRADLDNQRNSTDSPTKSVNSDRRVRFSLQVPKRGQTDRISRSPCRTVPSAYEEIFDFSF